jgi:hypothetical protein
MFPIASKHPLSFVEVANYWRREIKPAATFNEVLNLLSGGWWRGDLVADGAHRADLLRFLFLHYSDVIVFAVPGFPEPPQVRELSDGGVEVKLWRVPLPNSDQVSWDDANCSESYRAIAEFWDCDSFPDFRPVIAGLKTTEKDFTRWVASQEWPAPTFWAPGEDEKLSSNTKRLSKSRAIERAAEYFRAENEAGRTPTQQGFEKKMKEEGFGRCRNLLRDVFKKVAQSNQVELRRGRPAKRL